MLFEILFFVSLIFTPVVGVYAFVQGFKTGYSTVKTGELNIKKAVFRPEERPPEETEQERLQRIINMNIENYGTSIPQMDVE